MNVFILHAIGGTEQVGYYSVASQVADTLSILPQSIATVLFPRLVASRSGRLQATLRDATTTATLLGVSCAVIWLLSDSAIRLVFGPRFAPAGPVLRSMLPGVLLLGVISVVSQYLAASGFPISVVVTWFAAAALSVCLSLTLVSRYGAVGAGHALSVTYGLLLIVMLFLCWRTERVITVAAPRVEPGGLAA
jgi:O-antigen/teichoic acid export membrane protein